MELTALATLLSLSTLLYLAKKASETISIALAAEIIALDLAELVSLLAFISARNFLSIAALSISKSIRREIDSEFVIFPFFLLEGVIWLFSDDGRRVGEGVESLDLFFEVAAPTPWTCSRVDESSSPKTWFIREKKATGRVFPCWLQELFLHGGKFPAAPICSCMNSTLRQLNSYLQLNELSVTFTKYYELNLHVDICI